MDGRTRGPPVPPGWFVAIKANMRSAGLSHPRRREAHQAAPRPSELGPESQQCQPDLGTFCLSPTDARSGSLSQSRTDLAETGISASL